MCAVSMVGDHYRDMWNPKPWISGPNSFPNTGYPLPGQTVPGSSPTQQEFDELKRQVMEMKELLKRAKKYDEDNGEPECETDEKMALLRKIAAKVGVDLSDVI